MPRNPFFQQVAQAPNYFAGTPIMPSQMMSLSGMPGMDGPLGMILQMFLQPIVRQLSAQHGFIPLQFQPTQGAYDHLMANMIFRERMRATQIAAGQDQETFYRFFRGLAHLTGTPFGPAQQDAARSMAQDVTGITPFIAQFAPDLLDRISGVRGSATVMGQFMSMGLRYARDPITGLTGPPGETSGDIATRVFQNLYGQHLSLSEVANRSRGLTAGRMGQLFDEMQRRGFMGAGITERDRREAVAAATGEMIADPIGFAQRGHSLQQVTDQRLTNINADRITERLQGLAGAVGAMREIFGDMGRPNAPMVEIINGLQALTQGGLATMSSNNLEMTVRNIHQLVRNSGMTMDGMIQLMAGGARVTDRLGLSRGYVPLISQSTVGFSAAFAQVGGGDLPAWNAFDRQRATQTDLTMRANAANSFQANLLNSILSLDAQGMIQADSPAARLAEQIRNGTLDTALGVDQYFQVLEASGVGRGMALQSIHNRGMNEEFGAQARTFDLVRGFQREEFRSLLMGLQAPTAIDVLPQNIRAALGESGVTALQQGLGDIINMTAAQRQTPQSRQRAIIDMMMARLSPEQLRLLGPNEEAKRSVLAPVAFTFLGNTEQMLKTSPNFRHIPGLVPALQMFDNNVITQGAIFQREQNINAQLGRALAPFNLNPLSTRLVHAVMSSRPDSNIGELMSGILGGVQGVRGLDPERANTLQDALSGLFSQEMVFNPATGALQPADTDGGTSLTFRQALERFRRDPNQQNERIIAAHITRLMPGIQQAFRGAGLTPPTNTPPPPSPTAQLNQVDSAIGSGLQAISQLIPNIPGLDTEGASNWLQNMGQQLQSGATHLFGGDELQGDGAPSQPPGPVSSVTIRGEPTVQLASATIDALRDILAPANPAPGQPGNATANAGNDGGGTTTVELRDVEIVLRDERNVLNAIATLVARGSVPAPPTGGNNNA